MLKYVGKRILYMIGVFFVVSIILFVLFNNVPGDRALNQVQNLRGKVSDETFQLRYQEAREKLGLDDPIPVRYVKWMGNLLKGDLGYSSFYKKDVKDCLSTPLLNTIQINIVSTILALAITIPLGIHCAVKKFSKFDNTVQVLNNCRLQYASIYNCSGIYFHICSKARLVPDQWYEYAELPGNRNGIRA